MGEPTIRVRGLISCAGLWGSLSEGEERELPTDIAESLMRGGLAESVEQGEQEKKESAPEGASHPKRKSKRASES